MRFPPCQLKIIAHAIALLFALEGNLAIAQSTQNHNPAFIKLKGDEQQIQKLIRSGELKIYKRLPDHSFIGQFLSPHIANPTIQSLGEADNTWKLSPSIKLTDQKTIGHSFTLSTQSTDATIDYLKSHHVPFKISYSHLASGTLKIHLSNPQDVNHLLLCPSILFIDATKNFPTEEADISYNDLSVNKINLVKSKYPELNGNSLSVSIKERAFDTTDIDLAGRIISSPLKDASVTPHASQMATLIAGGGNSAPSSTGIAPGSQINSSSFLNLLPDDPELMSRLSISVQNHSYGSGIDNQYGAEARAYDVDAYDNPTLLHVFSAGNSGEVSHQSGVYAGMAGYATITGNFKMSKNTICVSAHYKDGTIDTRNSKGPAYDGRLKPELVAFGQNGTSDAAAIVSGTSLLAQQAYLQLHGKLPSSNIIKAALIAGADDIGKEGIDFSSGYGSVNADRSIAIIKKNLLTTGSIAPGETKSIDLPVPAGTQQLRIALTWIDPAANAGDQKALVNDLDLVLKSPGASNIFLPWVLNSYPHTDSLNQSPKRADDHLNNTEMITVANPAPGTYSIQVSAYALITASQDYSIAYWLEPNDSFQWTYPAKSDRVETPKEIYLRWNSTIDTPVDLEINYTDHVWRPLANGIDPSKGFYVWQSSSDSLRQALLRVKAGTAYYVSDTFLLSPSLPVTLGFNCAKEFMLNWPKTLGATAYQVFTMGEKYLEPIIETSDTSLILNKTAFPKFHYAVAPMVKALQGAKSNTLNYNLLSIHCYYSNFTGYLTSEQKAKLFITLSTLYNISQINIERLGNPQNTLIATMLPSASNFYETTDDHPSAGTNQYIAKIFLKDGSVISTDPIIIYYSNENSYFVFPNPVQRGNEIQLLTDGNQLSIFFYDQLGRQLLKEDIFGALYRIPSGKFPAGLYMYQFRRNDQPVASGRLLITE
jgi:hypothetical protein